MNAEIKCSCEHCGEHIAFPSEAIGQTIECPHCKLETLLFIPSSDLSPKKNTSTALFVFISLVLIAVIVMVGVAAFIGKTSYQSIQKPDDSLHEVKGAMDWNLGDILPNDIEVKTNDDAFGITASSFRRPAALENSDLITCDLILTEERRIAAILVNGSEDKQFNRDTLRKVLKEKYGLRESRNVPAPGDNSFVIYYFGKTNRQAILTVHSQSSFDLEYRDERLCELAQQQQEIRKTAINKQMQNDLRNSF
ncbi:MAG TPA: hypothetical protein VFV23_14725 [Verrucomicrobiae bacterium]|nr:hypothetical protein [Verrucomicrobiae bacterium]